MWLKRRRERRARREAEEARITAHLQEVLARFERMGIEPLRLTPGQEETLRKARSKWGA